jgi:methionyl-tRNA formyltransferase
MGDRSKIASFRILVITQEDPFYVRILFEEMFRRYRSLNEFVEVVIAPAMGKKSLKGLVLQMYRFYGFRDFLRMGIRFLAYKAGDKISRWVSMKRFFSIEQVCRHYGVPVRHCPDINSQAFLNDIRKYDLDLIVSVAAPQIFKEKLISIPKLGSINIHNSKLPKYRGMLPNFWQMYHGEKAVGTTVHKINAGIDDGEILLQKETHILPEDTLDGLICRTKQFGAEMLIEVIEGLKSGTLHPFPNIKAEATYFSFPTSADVAAFRKKGYRLL